MNHTFPAYIFGLLILAFSAGCNQNGNCDQQNAKIAGLEAQGFRPLFNGEDLSGWVIPENDGGHWKVVDGIIDYDALSEAQDDKSLYTEDTFTNYILYVEWRFTNLRPSRVPAVLPDGSYALDREGNRLWFDHDNADSGIFLRDLGHQVQIWNWHVGSGELYRTRNDMDIPAEERARATPKRHMDNPVGEWNRFRIELTGDRVTVHLNDVLVIEKGWLPGIPGEGRIGLQHHGGIMDDGTWSGNSSEIQFRNIWIKEI